MARIPRETVEAIRDRTDIVEVVGRHVKLQRRGASWVGLCPFHQEKSPSFHVIPNKAMFHCFGCQKSGDVFAFLAEVEGLSFVEAVKELAAPAGVTIEERQLTRAERDAIKERATLYDVLEAAASWFEQQLWTTTDGGVARDYLERRQITHELARSARIGWAPGGWTRLADHLHREGYRAELVVEAGLAKPRDRGDGVYDAFRERVVLPIRDERNRVIAFGGRLLEGDGPKYINSPETRLYSKSTVLYGLDQARRAIGQKDRILLVEGYFDVLSLHQAGFGEAVATCGTALTADHVQRLRRLSRNIIVLLDADEAGTRAAERTLPMVGAAGMAAWRLQIPGAKDPDDLIREGGPEAMTQALTLCEPLLTWVAGRKVHTYGYTAAGKERARDELAEMLGGLTPAQVAEVAPVLRVDERELLTWARAWRPTRPPSGPEPEVPAARDDALPTWKAHRDVVHLLWLLIHRYDQVADLVRRVDPAILDHHAPAKPAIARLLQGESVTGILDDEPDLGVRRTLAAVVARTVLYTDHEAARAVVEVMVRLARPLLEMRAADAHGDAVRFGRAGEPDAARAAVAAYDRIRRDLRALEAAMDVGLSRDAAPDDLTDVLTRLALAVGSVADDREE
ncbi:MAG: DNA primase [Alphaproteobacteria bacterium]|nr:DNA primase [Alphaproteobacteria bacterium]